MDMEWTPAQTEFVAVRESCDGAEILHVFSDVDMASGAVFESMLVESFSLDKKTYIDLTECPYFDSTGLRLLVTAYKALGSRLEVWVSPNSTVERVLAVSGLDGIVPIVRRPQAAPALPFPEPRKVRALQVRA
jgi:anti-anti-sigma factor